MASGLDKLLPEIRACTICADLPLGPRPVLRATKSARILIAGQAPGTKVHASGVPWDDPSGDRLRDWLGLDRDVFYDDRLIAIVPMGFCYPGRHERGGDLPPRKECAANWHSRLLPLLENVQLNILAGAYAQKYYLAQRHSKIWQGKNLTETVRDWRSYAADTIPLPHPSWRTVGWQKRNPWFDEALLPDLRARVKTALAGQL
jgi:uracil-DNA glycosylase